MDASNIITRDNDFIIQEAIQQYCYNESLKINKKAVWETVKKVAKFIIEKIKKLIAVVKDLIQTAFRKLNFIRLERMYKECKYNDIIKVKMEAYPDLLIYANRLKSAEMGKYGFGKPFDIIGFSICEDQDDFDKNNVSNLTDYDKMIILKSMTAGSYILIDYEKIKDDNIAMQIVNSNDPTKTILDIMKGNKQTTVLDLDTCYQFLQVSYKKSNAYFDKVFKTTLDTMNKNSQFDINYIIKERSYKYDKEELELRYANTIKYAMRMYGYMTSASLEAFQICNKQCIAAIILAARNAGYKDYDDYYKEDGRFYREELASDVAYGKISHEDLVAIINDNRFTSNCFGDKARFEKLKANFENKYKDKKMDDETLLLAINACVAEIFNGDYLLWLEQLRIKIKHK